MATTKRIQQQRRVLPSQQETQRRKPGLSPVARPTQAAAEPSRVDPRAQRLREISESLAAGSKAIMDFFTMEKSFEETNRIANRVRGELGLDQVKGPGRGLLDWGSDYGYQEGIGRADAVELRSMLEQGLQDNQFFVDPSNPDAKSTIFRLNQFINETVQSHVADKKDNLAYLDGILKPVAEFKIAQTVKAMDAVREAQFQQAAEGYSKWVSSQVEERLLEYRGDPQKLRDYVSELLKDTSRFNLDKDAGAELLVSALSSQIESKFAEGFNNPDRTIGLAQARAAARDMSTLVQSLRLKDSSGVPLGGFSKGSGSPMDTTLRALNTRFNAVVSELDKLETAEFNSRKIREENDLVIRAIEGNLNQRELLERHDEYREVDPRMYNAILKMIPGVVTTWRTDSNQAVLNQMISDPSMNLNRAQLLLSDGTISQDDYNALMGVYSNRMRHQNFIQSQQDRQQSQFANEESRQRAALLETNKANMFDYLSRSGLAASSEIRRNIKEQIPFAQRELNDEDFSAMVSSYNESKELLRDTAEINMQTAADTIRPTGQAFAPGLVPLVKDASEVLTPETIRTLQENLLQREALQETNKTNMFDYLSRSGLAADSEVLRNIKEQIPFAQRELTDEDFSAMVSSYNKSKELLKDISKINMQTAADTIRPTGQAFAPGLVPLIKDASEVLTPEKIRTLQENLLQRGALLETNKNNMFDYLSRSGLAANSEVRRNIKEQIPFAQRELNDEDFSAMVSSYNESKMLLRDTAEINMQTAADTLLPTGQAFAPGLALLLGETSEVLTPERILAAQENLLQKDALLETNKTNMYDYLSRSGLAADSEVRRNIKEQIPFARRELNDEDFSAMVSSYNESKELLKDTAEINIQTAADTILPTGESFAPGLVPLLKGTSEVLSPETILAAQENLLDFADRRLAAGEVAKSDALAFQLENRQILTDLIQPFGVEGFNNSKYLNTITQLSLANGGVLPEATNEAIVVTMADLSEKTSRIDSAPRGAYKNPTSLKVILKHQAILRLPHISQEQRTRSLRIIQALKNKMRRENEQQ